jgi:type IV secretory pathway TrbF-like protein
MSFPKINLSYGRTAQAPDTPYARAAAAWDDRIGSARVQALSWRYIAFGAMALALISTIGVVVLAVKKQVATYVVEINKAGMPGRITLASEVFKPESAQVGYFVGEVVRLVRERPLDPVVMRQQWTKAYQFLAGQAINGMNEFAATDTGLRSVPGQGATARTVEIGSILQKSEGTYQVRWVETSYVNGIRRGREEYTGLFQVKLMPPRDESDTFKNPIGVYVTNFTWSREFSGPVSRDDGAAITPPIDALPASSKGGSTNNSTTGDEP